MDDKAIVDLYWRRSEAAIGETDRKYGNYCYTIAYNVLANNEDAQECVNDTYLKAWDSIPPQRPAALALFLGKITRNLSISRWRSKTAAKRGGGEIEVAMEELEACVASRQNVESEFMFQETVQAFRRLLDTLPEVQRNVFLRRYFFLDPIADIARDFGFSQSKVKSMLHRTRLMLRDRLEREGLI